MKKLFISGILFLGTCTLINAENLNFTTSNESQISEDDGCVTKITVSYDRDGNQNGYRSETICG